MNTEKKKTRKDRILAVLPKHDQPGLSRNKVSALTDIDRSEAGVLLNRMRTEGLVTNAGGLDRGAWTKAAARDGAT